MNTKTSMQRIKIRYSFEGSAYRSCEYQVLTIEDIKQAIISNQMLKNISPYELQLNPKDKAQEILATDEDLKRNLINVSEKFRIQAKRVQAKNKKQDKKIEDKKRKNQQIKEKEIPNDSSEYIQVDYTSIRQEPKNKAKNAIFCCGCQRNFKEEEKIYIQIDNLDPVLVHCGNCDKNQTSIKTYGVSFKEFLKNKLDSSIRCIFILKKETQPVFFQANNTEELKESKQKLQSLLKVIMELQDNLTSEKRQKMTSRMKQLLRKHPQQSKKQLLQRFNKTK